jgi:hypothetical protein
MSDEMSCVFGLCPSCLYFFKRGVEEDGYEIRCLITDTDFETNKFTQSCSHFEAKYIKSLFLNDEFKNK